MHFLLFFILLSLTTPYIQLVVDYILLWSLLYLLLNFAVNLQSVRHFKTPRATPKSEVYIKYNDVTYVYIYMLFFMCICIDVYCLAAKTTLFRAQLVERPSTKAFIVY